jgi:hypothetical protein
MTRRSILKVSVALTATASLGITNIRHAEPLVSVPGIQLYTVDKELKADVEGTLKRVREIGYREVETAGPRPVLQATEKWVTTFSSNTQMPIL